MRDDIIERFARDEFHDHIRAIFIAAEVMHGNDMWMLERGESSRFLEQLAFGFFCKAFLAAGRDPFDRDFTAHFSVIGPIYGAQTPLTYFSSDFVAILHMAFFRGKLGESAADRNQEKRNGAKRFRGGGGTA